MSNNYETAQLIVKAVGGSSNVTGLTHCATRLRFELKNASVVDTNEVQSIKGVMGGVPQGDHAYQVVIGGAVSSMYEEVNKVLKDKSFGSSGSKNVSSPGSSKTDAEIKSAERDKVKGKSKVVDAFFEFLSDSFRPVIGVLLGASIILAIINLLIQPFGIISDASDLPATMFLNAIAMSVFYFLPCFVAYAAFKKLKLDPMVGLACMLVLFTPYFFALGDPTSYKSLFAENGVGIENFKAAITTVMDPVLNKEMTKCNIFGFDLLIYKYNGNVFVPLFMAGVAYWLDKGLKKVIPSSIQLVFVPFFEMLILTIVTAFILGPLAVYLGQYLGIGFSWLNTNLPFVFAIAIPVMYPFLVPLGLHWPLNALMLINLNTLGYDFIQGPMGTWNFACFGCTCGVFIISLKERDKSMSSISGGALFAGLFGGISEPSLYGIHLRYKEVYKRLLPACIVGGLTNAILSFFFPSSIGSGITTNAFAFTSILTIGLFDQTWVYAISIAASFTTAVFLVVTFDYRTKEQKAVMRAKIAAERLGIVDPMELVTSSPKETETFKRIASNGEQNITVNKRTLLSPVDGKLISITEVEDSSFSSKAMGDGVAIVPKDELIQKGKSVEICSPSKGEIQFIADTGHTFGITSPLGVSSLVHIGLDTVGLKGEGFDILVEKGQNVEAGQPIVKVDFGLLKDKGCKLPVVLTVPNSYKLERIAAIDPGDNVEVKDDVIEIEFSEVNKQ